jgi:peptide/nickel transport system permease protein
MIAFVLRRLLNIPILFVLSTLLSFVILQLGPGNPVELQAFAENRYGARAVEQYIREFGLDQPVMVQYVNWLGRALTGDLGRSLEARQNVIQTVATPVFNSMILVVSSLALIFVVSTVIGVYSAVFEDSVMDRTLGALSYFFLGFPSFFLAMIMVYLILELRLRTQVTLLPIGGMTSDNFDQLGPVRQALDILWHMTAPLVCVTLLQVALYSRLMRAQMIGLLSEDFVRTARAKGVPARAVLFKHTLRNALAPFVAGLGGLIPSILGGAGLIEIVFNWPGITSVMLRALNFKDFFTFLGLIAISIVVLIVTNLIADIVLVTVDPRVRYA